MAIISIGYLAYLIWQLATGAPAAVWIRFFLAAILVFFLLRGSRVAGVIWLVCNLLGALVAVAAMFRHAQSNTSAAMAFAVIAAGLVAHCGYLFFSPSVRRFQSPTS
ncbi:MAG: hypothetical protein QM761_01315 [Pseudoxanthomonas sp.]